MICPTDVNKGIIAGDDKKRELSDDSDGFQKIFMAFDKSSLCSS